MRRWPVMASSYVGAVVGAGFGSGREIAHFFAAYGSAGLAGALLAGGLFAWLGATALHAAVSGGYQSYGALLRGVCGARLGRVMDAMMTLFLFVTVAAVFAGAGAMAAQCGWPRWTGVLGLAVMLFVSGCSGQRVYLTVNLVLVPILALLTMLAVYRTYILRSPQDVLHIQASAMHPGVGWGLAAILYVAYNLLLGLAGLCTSIRPGDVARDAIWGGLVGGAALGVLAVALCLVLLALGETTASAELPLQLAFPATGLGASLFPVCLSAALWTTGSAAVSALSLRFLPVPAVVTGAVVLILALPIGMAGLVWIVAVLYASMGYVGIPLLFSLGAANARLIYRCVGGRRGRV